MVAKTNFVSGMQSQVGWFVILGFGAILFVLLLVSMRSNLFAQKFYLFVEPPSAATFYEGQPVKFQGFSVGHIDDIQLRQEGQVRIRLRLLERYRHMLHQGAVIHFVKQGLIGEQIVEITSGDADKGVLDDGQLLEYETEASLEQLLVDLKPAVNNANILLNEMAKLSLWMNDPYSSLQRSFVGLSQISEGLKGDVLASTLATLSKTITQLHAVIRSVNDQKIVAHLQGSLTSSEKLLQQVEPLTRSMGEQGPDIVKGMHQLTVQVDKLSSELLVVTSDLTQLTPELPGVAREARSTLAEMKATLKTLQESWLMGGEKAPDAVVDTIEVAPPVLDMQP